MNNKKLLEKRCFDLTREYVSTHTNLKVRRYINSLIPLCNENLTLYSNERPDFVGVLGDCYYVVEHFMIDFCNDGINNNQSESRRANNDVMEIYNKYHDPCVGTIKDTDINDATQDIENEINKISNIALTFDYDKYIEAFRRSFEKHYSRVDAYLSNDIIKGNCSKIGFLIEFHCDTTLMHAMYNNSTVSFQGQHRSFPITREIIDLFTNAKKLDFIIVTQFSEGVSAEAQDVRIYEPSNMEESLMKQHITVYDKVYYSKIKKNITLNLKRSNNNQI